MNETIHPGQFRLAEIQLYNWGTFGGLHTIGVGRRGFLVTGSSGSGKSTLIDAVSALLVPAAKVHYNAAAQEGGTRSGRNLVTYCRGAWRREHSDEYNELRQSYLRNGATWTGINLVYFDGTEYLSAIRLMHLGASCMSPAEITSIFLILRRKADLTEFNELAKDGLDLRKAKRQLPDAVCVHRGHGQFISAFRREVGIADQAGLSLLHRAQSAKSLGDLNQLMRDFMLPEPETLGMASKAVEQFDELNAAYQAVDTARKQVETLAPVKEAEQWIVDLDAEEGATREDKDNLRAFANEFELAQAQETQRVKEALLKEIEAQLSELDSEYEEVGKRLEQVQLAIAGKEGAVLLDARKEVEKAEQQRDFVARHARDLEKALNGLGAERPKGAEAFVELQLQLQELLAELEQKKAQYSPRRKVLYDNLNRLEQQHERIAGDIASLEKHRSAMDPRLLTARDRISALTGIDAKALPFVADLIKVRDSEKKWQPAAERVMGGFARTLLVADEHYEQVSDAINVTNLGAKLTYVRLTTADENIAPKKFGAGVLGTKIDVKDGRFFSWLQSQLQSRFDYVCVDSAVELRRSRRAVTVNGQVKHDHTRHEKDDRRLIDDRSRWVLSGNTEEKFDELRGRLREAERGVKKAKADLAAFENQIDAEERRAGCARRVMEFQDFADVDIKAADARVHECMSNVEKLEKGDNELRQWRADQATLSALRAQIYSKRGVEASRHGKVAAECAHAADRCEKLHEEMAQHEEISPASRARLDAAFHIRARSVRTDNLRDIERLTASEFDKRLEKIKNRRDKINAKVLQAMNEFLNQWPERRGDLQPDLGFRGDFLRLLEHLEADDLPKFVTHFREMLRKQTSQNLNHLLLQIQRATADIRRKIETEINPPLMVAEFDSGTHLQIEVREDQPAPARDLVSKLREVVDGVLNDEDSLADEQRFHKLKEVISVLQASDSNPERMVRLRLDTRMHVSFLGVEISEDGGRGAVYDSSQGLSGGQAQKLVFFCLAAALRYQLTGAGLGTEKTKRCTTKEGVSRFGTVILDEAFDRADTTFTRKAMDVFMEFGFHMVLATPEKMLQTIEHYIDGMVIVSCEDRKHSTVTPIGIEDVKKR
ncbi:ATP-binding protein [Corynebacterium vitaeruminis]|uniref:ATP-binding protein n=1 Tax=Corynebacterium vitaeruminis TaxID=38305 RepID=UPI0023F50A07|nr:ATP-binding protein [Corynebacterium vitaeruminis]